MLPTPVVLCILDGVGWGRRDSGDAVYVAGTPTLDRLTTGADWTLLKAHGTAVGLPSDGDMGNSEVGHNAMGAGRVFDQGAKLVENAIASGRIWQSDAWKKAVEGDTLHLIGLCSDGNVHSHIDHLYALIDRAHEDGVERLRVHVLTDGRDVSARSALTWVGPLEEHLASIDGDYAIATGGGRMHITMDRYEADWEMVARGWRCHVHGKGRQFESASEAIETLYGEDDRADDQWLPAFVVGDYDGMHDGDAVIFFNFRGDRAVEISRAFEEDDFDAFDRSPRPDVFYAGMMEYDGDLHVPKHYLVQPPEIRGTVGEALAKAGKTVLATSETQKFGHVTYFFNGNRSAKLEGETWVEIPSLAGDFDKHPEMKAREVTEVVCEAIRSGKYDHIRLNLANGDMVGHTGNFDATVEAMTVIDACVADIEKAVREVGGVLIVTADHGNADQMVDVDKKTGQYARQDDGRPKPRSSHSLNPVPFMLVDPTGTWRLVGRLGEVDGELAQVGASVLTLLGVDVPEGYRPSLVARREQR